MPREEHLQSLNYVEMILPAIIPAFQLLLPFFALIVCIEVIKNLIKRNRKTGQKTSKANSNAIHQLHQLTPTQFVLFCAEFFSQLGYQVQIMEGFNDLGADLVMTKDGIKTVVQVKRNTKYSGVEGVRQIVTAVKHYRADKGLVFSSASFTKNAITLAKANRIQLYDLTRIEQTLNTFPPDFIAKTQNATHLYPSLKRRIINEHGKDAVRKSLGQTRSHRSTGWRNSPLH